MPTLPPDQTTDLTDTASLRRLFTNLGYDPIEQTTYSARTLDWPDNVAVDLRGREFELLAEADTGYFQVLWLEAHPEMNGLPAELIKRLYGDLEKRGNEAILVLPSRDAGTFELVLLADPRSPDQRAKPLASFLRFSFDPRALQPHQQRALELLDVSNAGAGEAAELAARAFRRAQQERFFRSLNFFSTYYLERRIATDPTSSPAWAALLPQMAHLRAALAGADTNAALAALGWQVVSPLTPDATARLHANGSDAALIAIMPARQSLDQALANGSYPQLDLIAALEQEKQFDGLTWGVLTNGRTWRLYSRITASISGAFYEVDVVDLLEFGAEEDLRYFAGFFGPAGLATGFAEKVFYSSQMLAKEVGENLKKIVFEQVFARLANGIADDLKRRGKYEGDEGQRQLIFRATLVLLYRVLFLLYAESMRLLPTIYPPYYAGSLTRLLTEIALQPFTEAHLRKPMHPEAFWAWEWLHKLFATVSQGSTERGVPKYNGGLFSDGERVNGEENPHKAPHHLLAGAQIGAMDLCAALNLLGRDATARSANNQDEARRLIDYAALDVRRLGSIYEGLLEYQLVEKGDGSLELKQTSQGRKASGSYYTPDYIVAYIVEHAVGPVLAEREQRFAALMPEVLAARKALERAERQMGNERVSNTTARANHNAAKERLAQLQHEAGETLLDLKILDPAMGSGHFLVAAVDFVADRLIAILQKHKEGNPILERLDGIRAQIRASLREQGVDELITDEQLNNVNLLRRMVMKRCVYGVDLNDMAVELARLSLWLNSFTIGAPLSFLDHHLKWGNSLIGARVQAVQQAMEGQSVKGGAAFQFDMFASGSAFKEMLDLAGFIEELVEIADANAAQVEHSEELYRMYEQQVVPVKRLLDLWVSQSFGSKEARELISLYSGKPEEIQKLKAALTGGPPLTHRPWQQAIERARDLFLQHHFLHWDLDFPEVFIDLKNRAWKLDGEAGFDAVVGNPPWGAELSDVDKDVLRLLFNTGKAQPDTYRFFIESGVLLLRLSGYLGMIVPNSWLTIPGANNLRKFVLENSTVTRIIQMKSDVFNVNINSIVFVLIREVVESVNCLVGIMDENDSNNDLLRERFKFGYSIPRRDYWINQNYSFNITARPMYHDVINKIKKNAFTLSHYLDLTMGVQAYHNTLHTKKEIENRIYHSIQPIDETFLLQVDGSDIDRYETKRMNRPEYIKVGEWCYIYPGIEYMDGTRVLIQRVTGGVDQRVIAAMITKKAAPYKTLLIVKPRQNMNEQLTYFLSLINSKVINFIHRTSSVTSTQKVFPQLSITEAKSFPMRRIAFTTPAAERTALVDAAKTQYEQGLAVRVASGNWRAWRERWRALWDWAGARLPRQADGSPDTAREQSDAIHDLLAFLAERMIELHKQKQAGAAAFTGWLELETGSMIDEWSGKTIVQAFWEEPWENVERALQKNRAKFAQAAGLRGKAADGAVEPLMRAAKGRRLQATNALAPTLAAITATDRLIDLLVYRLYGLTDEEIDLVEGG